jgi:hypothetical protein
MPGPGKVKLPLGRGAKTRPSWFHNLDPSTAEARKTVAAVKTGDE